MCIRDRGEVERGARDPRQLAGGYQARVGGSEPSCGEPEFVVVDASAALAREVVVRVVREVDDRRPVGGGLVVDAPVAVPGEGEGHLRPQRARVAHLAVDARAVQVHPDIGATGEGLDVPHLGVEALGTPVQAVDTVVHRQLVGRAVQAEAAPGDAVSVPADGGAEEGGPGDIRGEVVVAERDVRVPAVPVRDLQGLDYAAVGQHLEPGAAVLQRPAVHLRAVGERAEEFLHRFPARGGLGGAAERGGGEARGRGARDDRASVQFHVRLPLLVGATNRTCACSTRRTRPPPAGRCP